MTSSDELRERLGRLDPVPSTVPVEPFTGPRAHEILERVMSTSTSVPTGPRRALLAAAAVLTIGAAVGGLQLTQRDDSPPVTATPTVTRLSLPGGGDATATNSCIAFDPQFLKGMSPAFGGTVIAVEPGSVTLDVDRWYAGGDADRVVLSTPDATSSAALDGVTFEQGQRYLVTAADGTVNGCGFSGPATPDLEKAFDEAFPT